VNLRHIMRDWLMAELDVCAPDFDPPAAKPKGKRRKAAPGELVLAAARDEWARNVREPSGRIDDYIRGPQGLGWGTADAINWTPDTPYTRDGMFQWCGAFAAFCWGAAGLRPQIRNKSWASTVRLYDWGQGSDRYVSVPDDLRPGDVVVVSAGRKRQGEHICIVDRVDLDAKLVHTIEGNARGVLGDGTVGEGVIKRTRPWSRGAGGWGVRPNMRCPVSGLRQSAEIAHAYRPVAGDL
jgi:hypothetical protein